MCIPAADWNSAKVRVEVQNRIKRKYPAVQEVTIVGEDGKPPSSA